MRYYQFHVGDYAAASRYLSLLEDLAFRRLLDIYYLDEKPLPASVEDCARLIGMREQVAEVKEVLFRFFTLEDGKGWVNHRADREIASCAAQHDAAKRAGQASAQRRRNGAATPVEHPLNDRSTPVEHPLSDRSTTVQPPITHNPIPNPPKPPKGGGADLRSDPEPEPDPADYATAQLHSALMASPYRAGIGNPFQRRQAVFAKASTLAATGLTPSTLSALVELADRSTTGDAGALLAHWLDGEPPRWREVLDEQVEKAKHGAARKRGKQAQAKATEDLLDGIYGETEMPKQAASVAAQFTNRETQ